MKQTIEKLKKLLEPVKDTLAWIIVILFFLVVGSMIAGVAALIIKLAVEICKDLLSQGIHSDGLKFLIFLVSFFLTLWGTGLALKWAFRRIE